MTDELVWIAARDFPDIRGFVLNRLYDCDGDLAAYVVALPCGRFATIPIDCARIISALELN